MKEEPDPFPHGLFPHVDGEPPNTMGTALGLFGLRRKLLRLRDAGKLSPEHRQVATNLANLLDTVINVLIGSGADESDCAKAEEALAKLEEEGAVAALLQSLDEFTQMLKVP